jgi:hypothetical protein
MEIVSKKSLMVFYWPVDITHFHIFRKNGLVKIRLRERSHMLIPTKTIVGMRIRWWLWWVSEILAETLP